MTEISCKSLLQIVEFCLIGILCQICTKMHLESLHELLKNILNVLLMFQP